MKRAFVIALAIHLCVLLGAGYIYVLPPEKREELFKMVNIKPKRAVKKVSRIAPPKKIRKPIVRPVKRRVAKPIQLIAAKTDIVPEFTISLPEPSQAVYTPEVALVRLPEPVVAEAAESFWGKDIEVKEKEIELESFGLQNLQPVGTVENPVGKIIFQIVSVLTGAGPEGTEVGMLYPVRMVLAQGLDGEMGRGDPISIGPFAVPPEEFIFYVHDRAYEMYTSNSSACLITPLGPGVIQYAFEDDPYGWVAGVPCEYTDVVFTITFLGEQGGF